MASERIGRDNGHDEANFRFGHDAVNQPISAFGREPPLRPGRPNVCLAPKDGVKRTFTWPGRNDRFDPKRPSPPDIWPQPPCPTKPTSEPATRPSYEPIFSHQYAADVCAGPVEPRLGNGRPSLGVFVKQFGGQRLNGWLSVSEVCFSTPHKSPVIDRPRYTERLSVLWSAR